MTFTIRAKAENVLRVLQRVSSLLTRKRMTIQSMQVNDTSIPEISCLTLVLKAEPNQVHWLVKQMKKCVDLFDLEMDQEWQGPCWIFCEYGPFIKLKNGD